MSLLRKIPVRLTSLLSFIFFFSGFAALIYQVAWQRILTVYYGVGSISITLIVSVYMFGMGIGALFGGFLSERVKNKIFLYFIIEISIGCFGLISLPYLNFLGSYTAGSNYLISFFYMFLFLSIPTILMGMTLPLLTKIFNNLVKSFIDTVSFLYFINTIGAACGAVFASYVIISFFGLDTAVYFAATINFLLAVLIFLAKYYPVLQEKIVNISNVQEHNDEVLGKTAYLLVFITGFLAIGYEISWFRIVGILVKDSPYAFSSVLSVYLTGIALGSYGMSRYLKKYPAIDKKNLFFLIQCLIGIYVILIFTAYYYLTKYTFLAGFTRESFAIQVHPNFIAPSLQSIKTFLKGIYSLLDVFLWPAIFMLCPTLLMGASFPLISLLSLSQRDKEGKTIGTVYFFNISGNVLGGVITGFLLLPYLKTESTLLLFSVVGILFVLFVSEFAGRKMHIDKKILFAIGLIIISVFYFPKQGQLYETMHVAPTNEFKRFFEEGRDGTSMVYVSGNKVWNYINGLYHGSRPAPGYHYRVLEAVSYAPKVDNILIIGYGAGSVAEAALKIKGAKNIVVVELNGALMKNLVKLPIVKEMLADNRLDLIIDDGRRFLLRTNEKFDIILIDPLRTTTAYSNNLYSLEFFNLVKQHLSPGGIFKVWMDEHRIMPKTVLTAFNYVLFYDSFCLASNKPFKRNDAERLSLFNSFSVNEQAGILRWDLKENNNTKDMAYMKSLLNEYPFNRDWKPLTEYYIGLRVREGSFMSDAKNQL